MLRATYTYRSKASRRGKGAGTQVTEREKPCEASELIRIIDRFSEMALDLDGRFPPGAFGDHAWISIVDQRSVFHAYFGEQVIRFEYHGPYPIGKPRKDDPYDGGGLTGKLDVQSLHQIIRLLDAAESPRQYILDHAIACSVVRD